METRISKWGNSQGVRLTRELLERAGMAVGDTVRVEVDGARLTLEKARRVRRRYRLEDLVARIPKESTPEEEPWGAPVGSEEW
jgi:antitoxin MazE